MHGYAQIQWRMTPKGCDMIGYKVMNYDPETGEIISGADNRLRFTPEVGAAISMPGQGIWMTLDRDYAITYYASHDYNAVLELEFDPDQILHGNLTDNQTEFSVPSARILAFEIQADPDLDLGASPLTPR